MNVNNVDLSRCERIAEELPLSHELRPSWDISTLQKLGFRSFEIDILDSDPHFEETDLGPQLFPMTFSICARIPYSNVMIDTGSYEEEIENIQDKISYGVTVINKLWKVLSNEGCTKLLLSLYSTNLTIRQAADVCDCSYALASHNLKILEGTGLIASTKDAGEKVYYLVDRRAVKDLYSLTMSIHDENFENFR